MLSTLLNAHVHRAHDLHVTDMRGQGYNIAGT